MQSFGKKGYCPVGPKHRVVVGCRLSVDSVMLKEGQLVKLTRSAALESWFGVWPHQDQPALVTRAPYERAIVDTIQHAKMTHLVMCVDVLLPSGKLISGVPCRHLEKA